MISSVIWIVMSNARMRSVTNYFIINLSMADIINATFNVVPNFTYMLTGNWPFGENKYFWQFGPIDLISSISKLVEDFYIFFENFSLKKFQPVRADIQSFFGNS